MEKEFIEQFFISERELKQKIFLWKQDLIKNWKDFNKKNLSNLEWNKFGEKDLTSVIDELLDLIDVIFYLKQNK